MRLLRRFLCGLTGHDLLRHIEPNRITMRCTSCQHETPGWTLKEGRAPTATPVLNAALIAQSAK